METVVPVVLPHPTQSILIAFASLSERAVLATLGNDISQFPWQNLISTQFGLGYDESLKITFGNFGDFLTRGQSCQERSQYQYGVLSNALLLKWWEINLPSTPLHWLIAFSRGDESVAQKYTYESLGKAHYIAPSLSILSHCDDPKHRVIAQAHCLKEIIVQRDRLRPTLDFEYPETFDGIVACSPDGTIFSTATDLAAEILAFATEANKGIDEHLRTYDLSDFVEQGKLPYAIFGYGPDHEQLKKLHFCTLYNYSGRVPRW